MTHVHAPRTVLIVDDEPYMRDLWKMRFTTDGFAVEISANGEEALAQMRTKRFDVILLDLRMPLKDGFVVLSERGSTLNDTTPIYVVTSLLEEKALQHARELGARETFIKHQVSPKQLVARVEVALQQ